MASKQFRFSALWSVTIHFCVLLTLWHSPLVPSFSTSASASSKISISFRTEQAQQEHVASPAPLPVVKPNLKEEPKPKPVKKVATPKKPSIVPKPAVEKVHKTDERPAEAVQTDVQPKTANNSSESRAAHAALVSSAQRNYYGKVIALIAKQKQYPARAERLRLEGTTELSIIISRNGELIQTDLKKESDSPLFNREAVRMAKAAAPFPALPTVLHARAPVQFSIPIIFELR